MVSKTNSTISVVPLSTYNWSLAHFGPLDFNPTVYCLLASFFAIALWLVIDLTAQIHFTFHRYRGLYYASIICTTWGIAFHAIAFILKLFVPHAVSTVSADVGTTFLAKLGWLMNTTGFSMVLYSRLGLVVQDRRILRLALAAICVDAILFHTPIMIFSFGLSTREYAVWLPYMSYMERIQIVGFTIQDFVLSTFYTLTSFKLLSDCPTPRRRNLFTSLLCAQAFGLLADTVMVILDYEDMFTLKASLHPFIYAMKLKIEFVVLNQLSSMVRPNGNDFVEGSELRPSLRLVAKRKINSVWTVKATANGGVVRNESVTCLRCQSLVGERGKRECAGSLAAENEKRIAPLVRERCLDFTQGISEVYHGPAGWNDEGSWMEENGLEDLERQYLGKCTLS